MPVISHRLKDVLVLGASGILGQYLIAEAEKRHYNAQGTYLSEPVEKIQRLDLAQPSDIRSMVGSMRPEIVLLPAAMTSVDLCESGSEAARVTNAEGPRHTALACREYGSRLVYFSTDYVFDGSSGPSDEEKEPMPINVYGRTKLEGERNVLSILPSALVIRTCANFGRNRFRSKENSVTWIMSRLSRKEKVSLFTDQWVSPSYTPDVAKITFDLLDIGAHGVFHVASRSCLTRFDMGMEVCRVFGLAKELIEPSRMADAMLPAPRPSKSCLAVGKVERTLNVRIPRLSL